MQSGELPERRREMRLGKVTANLVLLNPLCHMTWRSFLFMTGMSINRMLDDIER